MFGRRKPKLIDLNQIAHSAVDAFLNVDEHAQNGDRQQQDERNRFAPAGALALGVALAAGARAAYSRISGRMDLERVAESVEERLKS